MHACSSEETKFNNVRIKSLPSSENALPKSKIYRKERVKLVYIHPTHLTWYEIVDAEEGHGFVTLE